ncbi:hypothetical protein G3N55_07580 [Dissulfurirhabdus thermomarina]|uniref:Uncharacterized protein n=1 Tax=Dissulfurirhabdus thermomarina TaxID=1765737 RepID=A0A6N9TNH4_DISTH|nr:hypothetical protein [Dissulfurirhabdus thermomarina]NDY42699.1 hypothetical protein [Dissulfurirhabdus thermomarina]NMX24294.1 hypothetical protein [Dissulfurirhabdus thermomarina]
MKALGLLHCWEVMQCGERRFSCAAYHHPEVPCWQVARPPDDYRRYYHVCEDCIVRVLKRNPLVLGFPREAILARIGSYSPVEKREASQAS